MQKQAPTLGRLVTMAVFALSCFGLLLFLWLSFGGAIPLKPKAYRFRAEFRQAIQLADQADVRVAGISVGKVVAKSLDKSNNMTVATIEVNSGYAPIRQDAQAILRQKTLLGETYVELTPGTPAAPSVAENGLLPNTQVQNSVQLDQVIRAFDPVTRRSFQTWQQDLAVGANGQGQNLNDALGSLPHFVSTAGDLFDVLNAQSQAVSGLVRNTGITFAAIGQNTQQLRNLVTGSSETFSATAAEQNALAQTFQIFPTFLDESKATFTKLQAFATNAGPVVHALRPAAHDLAPTVRDLRLLAPTLRTTFVKLDLLITAAKQGLPALRDILTSLNPLLGNLDPFLEQLNPILQWLEYNQYVTGDFISNGAAALGAQATPGGANEVGHYLRQYGPVGPETLGIWPTRFPTNRGNAYTSGTNLADSPNAGKYLIFPNFDCKPSAGPTLPVESALPGGVGAVPGCWVAPAPAFQGNTLSFPHVGAANYSP
jgi:virulence factor Mce-like protein